MNCARSMLGFFVAFPHCSKERSTAKEIVSVFHESAAQLQHTFIGLEYIVGNLVPTIFQSHIISNGLLLAMFCSLMVTTADRFVAIKFPFRHNSLTGRNVLLIVSASWIPGICFVVTVLTTGITPYRMKVIHIVVILTSIFVLALSNLVVYFAARNHNEFLKQHTPQKGKLDKNLRASYVCFALVITFISFWIPYLIHDILELAHIQFINSEAFEVAVEQIALLNSLVDPILFVVFSKRLRNELYLLTRKITTNSDNSRSTCQ